MSLPEILLRLMGAFYVFAGVVVVRAAFTSRVMDLALAALDSGRPSAAERAQSLWHIGSAVVIFAGGALLMLLVEQSAWLFVASAAGQAFYLYWLAPRVFDPADPPDPRGRQQTTNAFLIYCAATALVLWALTTNRLQRWDEAPWPLLALAAAATAGLVGYAVLSYRSPLSKPSG